MRQASLHLKSLYGPGIGEQLKGLERQDNDPDLEALLPPPMTGEPLVMKLKRKRQSALMKDILKEGGYGDLAKMVSFRKGE